MTKCLRILGIRGIPAAHGGFETFAEHLAIYLVERGWDITVYCQEDGTGPVTIDDWRGVRRIRIPVATAGALGTIIFDWRSILHAARTPDLCLTLGYNTAIFNVVLRARGVQNIINMDGIEWKRAKWGPLAKLWFFLNERAGCILGNRLIADHPEIMRHLRSRTSSRKAITMIPYGGSPAVNPETELLTKYDLAPGKYLTVIARPEPENSLLEMVRAFSMRPRGVKLAVLGNYDRSVPYCRAVLEAASTEVVFLGPIYDKDILQALRAHCKVYMHGHQVGGTNPSLVEALAAGNAVIAHDNKFNRWVAGPTAQFFKTIEECDHHLCHILNDPAAQAESQSGSVARFQASFSWPIILQRYETILARHLGKSSEPAPMDLSIEESYSAAQIMHSVSPGAPRPNQARLQEQGLGRRTAAGVTADRDS